MAVLFLFIAAALLCMILKWHAYSPTPAVRLGPKIHLETGRVINIAGWTIYNVQLWPKAQFYLVNNPRTATGACLNGVNVTYAPAGYGMKAQDIAFNPTLCLSLWERVRN